MLADVFGGPGLLLVLLWLVVPIWAVVDALRVRVQMERLSR